MNGGHRGTVGRSLHDGDVDQEKIRRASQETQAERKKRMTTVCMKCRYYSGGYYESRGGGTCDYLLITGHSRPCSYVDCVEAGVFEPREDGKKSKPGWQLKRSPYGT